MATLARVFHIPFSVFSYCSHFHIQELTGIKIPSALVVGHAAMARLATSMFTLIKALHYEMLRQIQDTPLSLLSPEHDRLKYWPSPPFVSVLFQHVTRNKHLICESFDKLQTSPPPSFFSSLPLPAAPSSSLPLLVLPPRFQRVLTSLFLDTLFPSDLRALLVARLSSLLLRTLDP
eukprot:4943029-Karenia_brevis.AAC.1